MNPLLGALPEGSTLVMRTIREGVVQFVWGGPPGARLFDACVGGETRTFDSGQVVWADRPLLVRGAGFWLVAEEVCSAGGALEWRAAIALRRPGVATAEQAFTDRRGGAR